MSRHWREVWKHRRGKILNADRGDLLIRGFWDRSTDCIIDVRICDVNQASYQTRKPASIIKSVENEKKKKYNGALPRAEKALYSFSCLLRRTSWKGSRHIFEALIYKNLLISFVKARFVISLSRAKNRCIHGSRIPTGRISHRVNWEDGAGLVGDLKIWVDCQFTNISVLLNISHLNKNTLKNSSAGSLLGILICYDKRNIEAALKNSLHIIQGIY